MKDYSLDDQTFRDTANSLQFTCKIGDHRFKVCRDKPGFCSVTYGRKHWWSKQERLETYVPIDPIQFHLDAGTRCFSEDRYPYLVIE